ncbi:MAG: hypothetical protein B6I25_04995 [Planctomycetales bacterium 4572_13]|nr:MAG: hypothetical protein B6I25_04995 [Planctomycetales bacterium 4572_13]
MKTAEQIGLDLSNLVQGTVQVDICNREAFSTDASIYRILPQCIVAPRDDADIVAVVKYAANNQIPMAPRGAGSGLAGEALTSGIVLDVRRFMDSIIETADDGSWVRVQPGVVLDTLNSHLSKWGRKIGPDPSSGNRAVVGGVVANNATGAHSLQYGYIADFVQSIQVVLADGTTAEFTDNADSRSKEPQGRFAAECLALLGDKQELIQNAQPATQRNRCGYTIQNVIYGTNVNLAKLMAGSEGTLAVFSEITLRTVPVPKAKGLVQFEFGDFEKMTRAVGVIVDAGAAACELMDGTLIQMARETFPKYHQILPSDCVATLLVEQVDDDAASVRDKIEKTIKAVGALATGHLEVLDATEQALLWKARKDAVPLLNRQKGPTHPIAFIEDVSVDYRRLDEYIAALRKIGKKYDLPIAFYGHAGSGELHVRPFLDLSRTEEIQRMRQIAQDVFLLAWSLGGSISGEHADGLLRAAFIADQYGKEYYQILQKIKQLFDPAGILNPGKIINDDPDAMVQNLRAVELKAADGFQTELCFEPDAFHYEVEQCNGCGVCLAQSASSRMCPIFRGLNEELASSRAKANLLASWMAGQLPDSPSAAKQLKDILGLCVNCKMCSIECPAGVDVSKLIIEARTQLAHQTGFTATELALSHNRWMSVLASAFSPLSNWVMALVITRWVLEKTLGFDRMRRFPHFDRGSFIHKARKMLKRSPSPVAPIDKVVYFVDSYANWNDHELGFAVLAVLKKLNIEVVIPKQRPVPLPAFVYGNLKTARRDIEYNLKQIAPFVQQGYKILCSEPSAALCLTDEMSLITPDKRAELIAANTYELMDYLNTRIEEFPELLSEQYAGKEFAYHAPCHLKAQRLSGASIELLKKSGLDVIDINGGCCGLAGTAGMQKKHHEMSGAIGKLLADKIDACNPDIILTECAACKMQIEHLTGKEVLHPIKLLARAL